jgi:hypothetical protein
MRVAAAGVVAGDGEAPGAAVGEVEAGAARGVVMVGMVVVVVAVAGMGSSSSMGQGLVTRGEEDGAGAGHMGKASMAGAAAQAGTVEEAGVGTRADRDTARLLLCLPSNSSHGSVF